MALVDQTVQSFEHEGSLGVAAAIDLYGCDPAKIRDVQTIEAFVAQLCELINVERHGKPLVMRLEQDPQTTGYSLVQFIEESLISGHFAEASNAGYLDIVSATPYSPHAAARFCREFFSARNVEVGVVFRYQERQAGEHYALNG